MATPGRAADAMAAVAAVAAVAADAAAVSPEWAVTIRIRAHAISSA